MEFSIQSVDLKTGYIWGTIDKKIISITGKKENIKAYIEGHIIDGVNHGFTSNLTANCEVLDVYFWNRFPSFKEIESQTDIKK